MTRACSLVRIFGAMTVFSGRSWVPALGPLEVHPPILVQPSLFHTLDPRCVYIEGLNFIQSTVAVWTAIVLTSCGILKSSYLIFD